MAVEAGSDAGTRPEERNYVRLVMALICVSAMGIAGMTYAGTLESDPDEIIDVKQEWLPFGKEHVESFKNPRSSTDEESSSDSGTDQVGSCSGGFIGLLATLFPALIPPCGALYLLGLFSPAAIFLATVGASYRYRRQLASSVRDGRAWLTDVLGTAETTTTPNWPRQDPENDVHRAWVRMVTHANVERPWTRSPAECARAASEDGIEDDVVGSVTRLFEETRYGDAPLDEERRRQARSLADRIGNGNVRYSTDGMGTHSTDGGDGGINVTHDGDRRRNRPDDSDEQRTDDSEKQRPACGGESK